MYDDEEPMPVPTRDRTPAAGPVPDDVEESEAIEMNPGVSSSGGVSPDVGDPNQPRRRRRRRRGRRGRGRRGGGSGEQGATGSQQERSDRPFDEQANEDRSIEPWQPEAVEVSDDARQVVPPEVARSAADERTPASADDGQAHGSADDTSVPQTGMQAQARESLVDEQVPESEPAMEADTLKRARKPRTTRAGSVKKTTKKTAKKSVKTRTVRTTKVEPTGSSDKHHLDRDVPVDPLPPERPMSRFDLDTIPDDFDD